MKTICSIGKGKTYIASEYKNPEKWVLIIAGKKRHQSYTHQLVKKSASQA